MRPDERAFEDAIEASLLTAGGYAKGDPGAFDARRGLDTGQLFAFLRGTQAVEWDRLVKLHGGEEATAEAGFADRLGKQLDERGTVDVLRHGVVDRGVTLRLAFFRPAHGLTPELVARYEANRVTVTRQLPFEAGSRRTLDLALFVNGLPVATAELKNPLTGQGVEEAVVQYRTDRDPGNVTLARRAVVHFAVDPERVAMTTRLAGPATQFLPFNRGCGGGAGNRPNPAGHRSAYLWEQVWARDAWLDLLARFVHVERPEQGSPAARRAAEDVVFPRFHQWDAVRALEAAARAEGPGRTYLVQHSAGSGKSNTIAWLAHRLSTLHDAQDAKVFDKVVVITDRVVLDRQLQDTIYQFEHVRGVVQKIDESSTQLAEALTGEAARVVVTTLQKFPFVVDKVADLGQRRYAVVIDEAHSSQTGEAAKDLKAVLGSGPANEAALEAAEAFDTALPAPEDAEEALARQVAARGRQPNLSFFAFTATPKAKTLELFGTYDRATRRYERFHLYSMRQAIEEGFILDVLANYTTYRTYWKISKTVAEDPEYDTARAKRAIARFVELHPHNLDQKAEIVVEHFRARTARKIGGLAKAMVVTSSRLHAVRYKQAIDRYLAAKRIHDVAALVAFSGKVLDGGDAWTEAGMNGFPESQTALRFAGDDYQVLVVAEKFQTGFDQPLLHTMFVDKVLTGLAAVQTLSRLNRIHPGKDDTFVLDFRNDPDTIQEAFAPYYGRTVALPTDPNLLYDTRNALDAYDVLRPEEVEAVVRLLLAAGDPEDHGAVYAALDPAVGRFRPALAAETQAGFRDDIDRFLRTYGFLSQIVNFGDTKLERDFRYCRALAACLGPGDAERLDLGREVELTHLRLEVTSEGSVALEGDERDVRQVFDGHGSAREPDEEPLSRIVELLNERFGLHLTDADQLLFDQFEEEWAADPDLAAQARNNTLENFRLVFERLFLDTVVSRMDANEAIFKRVLDDPDFRDLLEAQYVQRIYDRLRAGT